MFRLSYIKAVNVAGFLSGLGVKRFELDLKTLINKRFLVIIGDNGSGKSTLRGLLTPLHYPIAKQKTFIVKDKEGLIIREYIRNDGFTVRSKCIYSPNNKGGHTSKAFLAVAKSEDDEFEEMNPTGNISSYYVLLETYMGMSEDGFNLTSYYDDGRGLVDMTPMERKTNISKFIPNTERVTMYHKIVDEKYKEIRNLIKNVSQKLGRYRDEDTLEKELSRVENIINKRMDSRESYIKDAAVLQSEIKHILNGQSEDEIEKTYRKTRKEMNEVYEIIGNLKTSLSKINEASGSLTETEKKLAQIESGIETYTKFKESRLSDLYSIQDELIDLNAILYLDGIDDLDSLKNQFKELTDILNELEYTKHAKRYENLYKSEAEMLMNTMDLIRDSCLTIWEKHGNLVYNYFNKIGTFSKLRSIQDLADYGSQLTSQLNELTFQINSMQTEINRLEGYGYLNDQLNLRPNNCQITSCPFLTEALKWEVYESELNELKIKIKPVNSKRDLLLKEIEETNEYLNCLRDLIPLVQTIMSIDSNLKKYLNVSSEEIIKELTRDTTHEVLSLNSIRDLMTVLSEKDYYYSIVNELIPQVERQIHQAERKKNDSKSIKDNYDKLKLKEAALENEITKISIQLAVYRSNKTRCEDDLVNINHYNDTIQRIEDAEKLYRDLKEVFNQAENDLDKLITKMNKLDKTKSEIKDIDREVQPLMIDREKLKFEYQQVLSLKADKADIEKSFIILEALQRITRPGKGLWKKIISIYMQDIKDISNVLLEPTFDGNLQLEDFEIGDDEFTIPFSFNGIIAKDISYGSSSQKTTMSSSLSLAIMAPFIMGFGQASFDEIDKDLSPKNKRTFISVLDQQFKVIGIQQAFIITHSPEYYEPYDVGYILFPSSSNDQYKSTGDYVEIYK